MNKFFIIANEYLNSRNIANDFKNSLLKIGFIEEIKNPDLVIIIGGDGTLLSAIQHYNNNLENISFLTINSGSLGFNSFFSSGQIEEIILMLKNKQLSTEYLDLLETKVDNNIVYALNEIRLSNIIKTLRIDMYINNELLQKFKGSGIVIATKTGSSGFNKAINGPIILANTQLMVVSELVPVNNAVSNSLNSSIVLDANDLLKMVGNFENDNLIIDGNLYNISKNQKEIMISLSKQKLKLLYQKDHHHTTISRLRHAFKIT